MKNHDTFHCAAPTIVQGCGAPDFARGGKLPGPHFGSILRPWVSKPGFRATASQTRVSTCAFGSAFWIRVSSRAFSMPSQKCACEKDCQAMFEGSGDRVES